MVVQFRHRERTLAMHRAEAIGGRVAATDDHDVFTSRRDARRTITLAFAVGRPQVRHRRMDSAKTTTRYVGVSDTISPDRQDYRLEIRQEVVRAHVHSDGAVSDESGPLGGQLVQPPVDEGLGQLEFRNSVAKQSPIRSLRSNTVTLCPARVSC